MSKETQNLSLAVFPTDNTSMADFRGNMNCFKFYLKHDNNKMENDILEAFSREGQL